MFRFSLRQKAVKALPGSYHPTLFVCPTLVGRTSDLAVLQALVHDAQSGQGHFALIRGEAGIGKSRLVAETKACAADLGFLLLQGNCFRSDRFFPYAPLLELLRAYISAHAATAARDLEPLAPALSRLLPDLTLLLPELTTIAELPPLDPEQERHRLFAILTHFLTQQAEQHPVLFVIEDLHWCDETSLEFLLHLAPRCPHLPILLLCTYRSDEFALSLRPFLTEAHRERLAQEITLTPLSRDEVEEMLREISLKQHPLPADLLEAIYPLAEGNPFFVEELLSASLARAANTFPEQGEKHSQGLDAPVGQLPLPRSVQEAIQQRTERLSPQTRHVLTLAAVAGRRFDFAVLQQVLNCDEAHLLELIKGLIAAQLVVEESAEQFAFRHALTRQAVYEGLLARERTSLHRAIAEALESLCSSAALREAHLADLAAHCSAAEMWAQALEYGQRLGEKALALSAPRAAVQHVTGAMGAAHQLAMIPPATLYRVRGQAYDTLGVFERARADYEQALHLARMSGERSMEWQCLHDLGLLWTGRDYQQAGSWFRQALELALELASPSRQARSLNRLGNWLNNVGQTEEGLRMHHEALALFEELQDTQGMAETLDLLGVGSGLSGDVVNGVKYYERSIELQRTGSDPRALSSSLSVLGYYSSPCLTETSFSIPSTKEACLAHTTEALHLAIQADWHSGQAFAEMTTGHVLAAFGEFGGALAHAHKALHLAADIAHQQWMAGSYYVLAHIYVLLLAPHLALQQAEAGLAPARSSGSTWWIDSLAAYYALAHMQRKELEQAEALLVAIMPREHQPRSLAERRVAWAWGELALMQGNPALALERAEYLLASAPGESEIRSQPIPALLKLKGEALLALSRLDEARVALEEAKRGAQERHCPSLLWQVHRSLGQAYHLLKREEQAQREWMAARQIIEQLAATIEDAAVREHFSHTALTSLPKEKPLSIRRATASQFGGLTEREREVASLIAQGKSNREIAETLVISYRTVETHIANIMFKLGCTSRSQVAAWVVEKGLTKPRV
jgi:DNA-binding CsgD family transcriptional regulator/tetratricopeptide (TPR) repeat protein